MFAAVASFQGVVKQQDVAKQQRDEHRKELETLKVSFDGAMKALEDQQARLKEASSLKSRRMEQLAELLHVADRTTAAKKGPLKTPRVELRKIVSHRQSLWELARRINAGSIDLPMAVPIIFRHLPGDQLVGW